MTTHPIHHMDSRDGLHLIPDKSVHAVVTDPPYGVDFVSKRAETAEGQKLARKKVANDETLEKAIEIFHQAVDPIVEYKMVDDADLYVFTRWDIVDVWMDVVKEIPGIDYKMLLVWDKGYPGMGDIDANWGCGHELILYCKKGRRDVAYRRSGIISAARVLPGDAIHPTEKPVPLMSKLIEMSTTKGDLVVDPFSGSGATSVAAKELERNSIAFEIDAEHVENSRRRLTQNVLF